MDFKDDSDDDLSFAIRLSEIESQQKKQSDFVVDQDFEYALKLSKALNSPLPSSEESIFPPDLAYSDYMLTKKLAEDHLNLEERVKNTNKQEKSETANFECTAGIVDEDFLLAVKLVEDNSVSKNNTSSTMIGERESTDTIIKFSSEIPDSDYELAVMLAEELNGSKQTLIDKDHALALKLANEFSEPNFNFVISDEDLVTLQSFEKSQSDVEITNVTKKFGKPKPNSVLGNSSQNKEMNSHTNTKSSAHMNTGLSVVDPSWETIDPNPDIYSLFLEFNKRFFWSRLDMVEVKWSPRMTLCAGICCYQKRAGHCVVKLSKPLLTYRPRKDLVETLLHEMIHAYLFVTNNDRDRDGHGPRFHQHMHRINRESGSNITIYHDFHDEVKLYKTHVWKCDGPCQNKRPFYGLVKRSMNRTPGPNDLWWAEHLATCGGKFHKIKEPENYGKKKSNKSEAKAKKAKETNISPLFFGVTNTTNAFKSSSISPMSNTDKTLSSLEFPSSSTSQAEKRSVQDSSNSKKPASSFDYFQNPSCKSTNDNKFVRKPVSSVGNAKIVTLGDLSKNLNKKSSINSPAKSPKKWAPLPGQKNILSFIHKS